MMLILYSLQIVGDHAASMAVRMMDEKRLSFTSESAEKKFKHDTQHYARVHAKEALRQSGFYLCSETVGRRWCQETGSQEGLPYYDITMNHICCDGKGLNHQPGLAEANTKFWSPSKCLSELELCHRLVLVVWHPVLYS